MAEKKHFLTVPGLSAEDILALVYGSFLHLIWTPRYVYDNTLLGETPGDWRKGGDALRVQAKDGELEFTTKAEKDYKEHIEDFVKVFEYKKNQSSPEAITEWKKSIEHLREESKQFAVKQKSDIETANRLMNMYSGKIYITYGIIGVNFLVFMAMVASGVNFIAPSSADIVKWGGNAASLTTTGDWWRLITNTFVHIGLIHLAANMFGLFVVGNYLERMLGWSRYLIIYLCLGVIASLASMWWHRNENMISAGASGAIFGMYGVFVALLTTPLLPTTFKRDIQTGMFVFIGYNLVYGLKGGVDNSAHIGGLLSGLLIGYLYYFSLKDATNILKSQIITAATILVTVVLSIIFIQNTKPKYNFREPTAQQIEELKKLIEEKYGVHETGTEDNSDRVAPSLEKHIGVNKEAFKNLVDQLQPLEEEAMKVYDESGNKTIPVYLDELKSITLKNWEQAEKIFNEKNVSSLDSSLQQIIRDIRQYCLLNKRKAGLMIKTYQTYETDTNTELTQVESDIDRLTYSIKHWQP